MPSTCSSTALLAEGLSAQTVVHHHRVLHQALGQAVKWDLLPRNVVEWVIPPKRVKPELRILTVSEVRRLLGLAEGTDYFLPVHLAVHTGLRRSELCGLLWSDVDLDARALTVVRTMVSVRGDPVHFAEPKSRGSRRVVAFGSGTASLLRERRDAFQARGLGDSVQVCARRDGSRMMPDTLSRGYKALAERCGTPDVRFHDLRHTHASLLLAFGVPMNVVQARMGHESIQTTVDIYGHVLPASDVEADEVLERQLAAGRLQNVSSEGENPSDL